MTSEITSSYLPTEAPDNHEPTTSIHHITEHTEKSHRVSKVRAEQILTRQMGKPLAEVLLPALRWRIGKRRITIIASNPLWEDLLRQHGLEVLERYADRHERTIHLLSSQDGSNQVLSRRLRFENFIQDPGNEFTLKSCQQVLEAPGVDHNPLYIHGPSGCGKSHLLRSIVAEFRQQMGRETALYMTADDWISHGAIELAESHQGELGLALQEAVIICFDNVHQLAGRELAQEELFHLINRAMEMGQQIIIAGDAAPRQLPAMQDRVSSRLAWGLVCNIDMPLVETRIALLHQLADTFIEDIESQQLAEIIEALAPDGHQVVALADRYARGEVINLGEDKVSLDTVIEIVAKQADLRAGDLAGKRRHRPVSEARQTAMLLARRLTGHSLEALGGMIGGRDHSTVMYLIKQAEERLHKETGYYNLVSQLTQQILQQENPHR